MQSIQYDWAGYFSKHKNTFPSVSDTIVGTIKGYKAIKQGAKPMLKRAGQWPMLCSQPWKQNWRECKQKEY